jgi:hypothetical protein
MRSRATRVQLQTLSIEQTSEHRRTDSTECV